MQPTAAPTPVVRFGVFEVDLRTGELRKQGLKIKLHGQPMEVLGMLLEHPGDLVTREEIQKRLWPAETFVDFDIGLNQAVKKLREALGDDADNPRFVETLPRKGYRFIAHIESIHAATGEGPLRAVGVSGDAQQLLQMLLEHPNQPVTRDEIIRRLFDGQVPVNLDEHLDLVLGLLNFGCSDNRLLVETIPGGGFSLRAPSQAFTSALKSHAAGWAGEAERLGQVTPPLLPTTQVPVACDVTDSEKAPQKRPSTFSLARRAIIAAVTAALEQHRARVRWQRWTVVATFVALVTGAALAYWLTRPPQTPRVTNVTQLTYDGHPKVNLFTDGARLYFTKKVGNRYVLAQASVTGGEPIEIATPLLSALILDISPNNSQLLVGGRLSESTPPGCCLWAVPTLGGSPRKIQLGNLASNIGAWGPDGKRVFFADGRELYVSADDGSQPHNVLSLAGRIQLVRRAPIGKGMRVIVYDPGSESIVPWEMDLDGNRLHRLPSSELWADRAPNGRYHVYSEDGEIWAVAKPAGFFHRTIPAPVKLTSGPIGLLFPHVSADGKKILVVGREFRGELVRYDKKADAWVPYLGGVPAEYVSFSRDGKQIAYVTFPSGDLWRSKTDGTGELQLTSQPLVDSLPSWSPDGKRIAFAAKGSNGGSHIFAVSAEGASAEQLTFGDGNQRDPSWSSDGSVLAFTGFPAGFEMSSEGSIGILNLRTRETSILPNSQGMWGARWSPDGRYIAASKKYEDLMLYDTASHRWASVSKDPIPYADYISWSNDSQMLYFRTHVGSKLDFFGLHVKERLNNRQIANSRSDLWSYLGLRVLLRSPLERRGPENYGQIPNLRPDIGEEMAYYGLRLRDRKVEQVATLKDPRVPSSFGNWLGLAPDNSPLALRDIGSQDIYALDFEAP